MSFLNIFDFFDRNLMDWVSEEELKEMFDIEDIGEMREMLVNMDQTDDLSVKERRNIRQVIKNTIKYTDHPTSNEIKKGGYSTVYMNTMYNNTKSVVKVQTLEGSSTERADMLCSFFFEAIITKIMYKISKEIPCFESPNVLRCGKQFNKTVMILEQIDGISLYDTKEPEKAVKMLANTLRFLQDIVSFSHRDLHGNNVLYNGNICIIDYGFACISMPPYTNMSIQDLFSYYRPKLEVNNYPNNMSKSLKSCQNRSHDLCTIILSMDMSIRNNFIHRCARKISLGYMKAIRSGYDKYTIARMIYDGKYRDGMHKYFFPDVEEQRDYTYFFLTKPVEKAEDVFLKVMPYQWVYEMYEIEIEEFVPEIFLKEYEKKPCLKF